MLLITWLINIYFNSFKSIWIHGNLEEAIVIANFKDRLEFESLLKDDYKELQSTNDSLSLIFHVYNKLAIKANELAKTAIVSDIPLFLNWNSMK